MLLQLPVDDHVGRVHSYPSSVAFFCDLPASASIQAGGDVFVYGGCHGDVSIAINAPSANQSSPSPFVYIRNFNAANTHNVTINGVNICVSKHSPAPTAGGTRKLVASPAFAQMMHNQSVVISLPTPESIDEYSKSFEAFTKDEAARQSHKKQAPAPAKLKAHAQNTNKKRSNVNVLSNSSLSEYKRDEQKQPKVEQQQKNTNLGRKKRSIDDIASELVGKLKEEDDARSAADEIKTEEQASASILEYYQKKLSEASASHQRGKPVELIIPVPRISVSGKHPDIVDIDEEDSDDEDEDNEERDGKHDDDSDDDDDEDEEDDEIDNEGKFLDPDQFEEEEDDKQAVDMLSFKILPKGSLISRR
jgi:hypothetical protein